MTTEHIEAQHPRNIDGTWTTKAHREALVIELDPPALAPREVADWLAVKHPVGVTAEAYLKTYFAMEGVRTVQFSLDEFETHAVRSDGASVPIPSHVADWFASSGAVPDQTSMSVALARRVSELHHGVGDPDFDDRFARTCFDLHLTPTQLSNLIRSHAIVLARTTGTRDRLIPRTHGAPSRDVTDLIESHGFCRGHSTCH